MRGAVRDPVTEDLFDELLLRDGLCLAPKLGFTSPCAGWFGGPPVPTFDHIHNGGKSVRGPSTRENGAILCGRHHRDKTDSATAWRLLMDAWVAAHPSVTS
jgi:hypothetical protein